MDIDHEAKKHKVPRSTVAGEAERAEAEDSSDKLQEVLDGAKGEVEGNGGGGGAGGNGDRAEGDADDDQS